MKKIKIKDELEPLIVALFILIVGIVCLVIAVLKILEII